MIDVYYFEDLGSAKEQIAHKVSAYTSSAQGQEQGVAPINFDEVIESKLALVAFIGSEYAGYIRGKEPIFKEDSDYPYQQVGTLVVTAAFANRGVGSKLVEEITRKVVGKRHVPYAFCNKVALPRFVKAGYVKTLPGELPVKAISLYGNESVVYPMNKYRC